jgi:hypothetical protein
MAVFISKWCCGSSSEDDLCVDHETHMQLGGKEDNICSNDSSSSSSSSSSSGGGGGDGAAGSGGCDSSSSSDSDDTSESAVQLCVAHGIPSLLLRVVLEVFPKLVSIWGGDFWNSLSFFTQSLPALFLSRGRSSRMDADTHTQTTIVVERLVEAAPSPGEDSFSSSVSVFHSLARVCDSCGGVGSGGLVDSSLADTVFVKKLVLHLHEVICDVQSLRNTFYLFPCMSLLTRICTHDSTSTDPPIDDVDFTKLTKKASPLYKRYSLLPVRAQGSLLDVLVEWRGMETLFRIRVELEKQLKADPRSPYLLKRMDETCFCLC